MTDRTLFAYVAVQRESDTVIYISKHLSDHWSDVEVNMLRSFSGIVWELTLWKCLCSDFGAEELLVCWRFVVGEVSTYNLKWSQGYVGGLAG
jgi:hypothetical protein